MLDLRSNLISIPGTLFDLIQCQMNLMWNDSSGAGAEGRGNLSTRFISLQEPNSQKPCFAEGNLAESDRTSLSIGPRRKSFTIGLHATLDQPLTPLPSVQLFRGVLR